MNGVFRMEYAARIRVYRVMPLQTPWDLSTNEQTDPALRPESYQDDSSTQPVLEIEIPKLVNKQRVINLLALPRPLWMSTPE